MVNTRDLVRFDFAREAFKQIEDLAMGSLWGSTLANMFVGMIKQNVLDNIL